jgi:hypothetical protein
MGVEGSGRWRCGYGVGGEGSMMARKSLALVVVCIGVFFAF